MVRPRADRQGSAEPQREKTEFFAAIACTNGRSLERRAMSIILGTDAVEDEAAPTFGSLVLKRLQMIASLEQPTQDAEPHAHPLVKRCPTSPLLLTVS